MRRFRSLRHGVAWLGLVLAVGCTGRQPPPEPEVEVIPPAESPTVRVALLTQVREVYIGSSDSFILSDDDGVLVVGGPSESFNIRLEQGRVLVFTQGGELMDSVEGILEVAPRAETGEVLVNGARYPQTLEIRPSAQGGLNVINVVDVEIYLRAVVPLEIGHQDPGYLEAAKAQAVAARTYVAGHMNQYPDEGFDLYAGITDQVYGSVDRRHPNADRAVLETRGLILVHDGKPIRANYSSTCGGKTAGVEESFAADPIPYLKSHDDKLGGGVACRRSKYYRWEETWTGPELKTVLTRTLPRVLNRDWKGNWVTAVEAASRGKSGRVVRLRVTTDEATYEVERGAIRQLLETTSGRPLRSTHFEIEIWMKGDRIRMMVARGRGWGHGVGMCQWGAMQLSTEGFNYRNILEHYYPGARLVSWPAAGRVSSSSAAPAGVGGRVRHG